jgi:hypothetical protein
MSKHASKFSILHFRTKLVLIGILLFAIGSVFTAGGASAANPSANLDQCANDPIPSPNTDGCNTNANQWVNGNLGGSKAVYFEGDSIPYRMRFDNLSLGSHTVIIEWDTTKSGKHAIDYLTTFNRTVANANPCLGVSPCGSPTTFAIPADPQVTGAGVTPIAGNFTFYGGTITSVSAYSGGAGFPAGDQSRQISITFTPTQANPVLAWGGHIATRQDWGSGNSAVAIPGSPYHMRLIALDGSGGNQDRSLSADAVIFPGSITIIKHSNNPDATSFPYTTAVPTGGDLTTPTFNLVDNSALTDPSQALTNVGQTAGRIVVFGTYTVTETVPTHWTLNGVVCVDPTNNSSQSGSGASINIAEGEAITCTFTNSHQVASPTIATTLSATTGSIGASVHDSASLTGATSDAGGTVTFTVYSDDQCTLNARDAGTKNVTNGVVPDSDALVFNSAGTFYWQAVYSGDFNNNGATSACQSEILVIAKTTPTITTTATNADVGGSISDTAHISGLSNPIDGTISFTLYSDAACANDVFSSGSTPAVVDHNGDYVSGSFSPQNAGDYFWRAFYSGDDNNTAVSTACGDTGETSTISPVTPTITTLATAEVNLGSPISDTATISGLVNPDGTGTITFTAYSDNTCATSAFSSTVGPVTADGDYNSGNFTPVSAGTYYWIASFSGDGNNDPATTLCGDPGESSIVKQQVRSQITPTATTCSQFSAGTSPTLDTLNYSVKKGLISQVDPGVFFYWIKVDAVAGANSFTIDQDITSANFSTYFAKTSGSALFTSSCVKVNSATITQSGLPLNGDVTVSFNASSAGTYIIGIKYDSGSVKGVAPPTGTGIATYTFSVGGTGTQGLSLKPKP